MATKTIAVVGATGAQGGGLLRAIWRLPFQGRLQRAVLRGAEYRGCPGPESRAEVL